MPCAGCGSWHCGCGRSAFSGAISHTAARDAVPPAVPGGLTISAGFGAIWLSWTASAEAELHHDEIRAQSAATPAPGAGTAASMSVTAAALARPGLPDEATRHYWVRAADISGNRSGWWARVQAKTMAEPGMQIDDLIGQLDGRHFGAAPQPVRIISSGALPGSLSTQSITYMGDLCTWNGPASQKVTSGRVKARTQSWFDVPGQAAPVNPGAVT